MNNSLIVSQTIEINAPLSKVWEGLTTPSIIKQYLYGTNTETDWKVGSEIVFHGEYEGHVYRDRGVVVENEPLKKLSYSYWSGFSGLEDKPENYSSITYLLEEKRPGVTSFTWIQKGYADEERKKHSEEGMPEFLAGLKKVIENA